LWIAAENPLPELISQHNDFRRSWTKIPRLQPPPDNGPQPHDRQIVLRNVHALHRLTAVISDEEIEGPAVCRDSLEGLCVLLPFLPLLGRPAARAVHCLAVGSPTVDQHQFLRTRIWWRRQEHALNQAQNR